MAKEFEPKIVSANDLLDGDVVYLEPGGAWTRHLSDAAVADSDETADRLLVIGDQPSKVVGPYLVGVTLDDHGVPTPTHFREKYRELGPTSRPDLGRQADPNLRQNQSPRRGDV
ncbi:MAG: DUF2849 domain-containing protein [Geminicoccaceae bacterium]